MVRKVLIPTDLVMTLEMGEYTWTSMTSEILLLYSDTTDNLDMMKEMIMELWKEGKYKYDWVTWKDIVLRKVNINFLIDL